MDRRVEAVIAMVKGNPTVKLNVARLAGKVGLSESGLRHLFKLATEKSLSEFAVEIRLERAKMLLLTSFLSVKEVAANSGFQNSTCLIRVFKKHFGVTPGKWRALLPPPASHLGSAGNVDE